MRISPETSTGKNPRSYIPESFTIENWEGLKPFYEDLKTRPINSVEDLEKWLFDRSELDAVVSEESRWRYIFTSICTIIINRN